MIARGQGHIGIVDRSPLRAVADAPSYCASKAAVLSYGLGLRGAVAGKGIRVSVVCPGYVDTPMIAQETGCSRSRCRPRRRPSRWCGASPPTGR